MEKTLFNNDIQNMKNYIMFEIKAHQNELTPMLKSKNRAPIALSMGAPVDRVPEFAILKANEYMNQDSLHTYSTPKGEARYLEAVSTYMKERFNVEINPKKEAVSLIGSKEGLSNLVRALINPNDEEKEQDIIFVPEPGYASYSQMIKIAKGRAYGIKLTKETNFQPNLDDVLAQFIKEGNNPSKIKALIINYPNNPLGCTCSFEYLQHCVDFCNKHNILLISDNAYCEMYFDEEYKPHSALECKGARDCCIEMYSFSKSYAMTGWRLGWACGNELAVTMLSRMKSTVDTGIFKVLQYIGADLLESSEGWEYIDSQNIKFKNKIQKFVNGLNSLGYNVQMPKATFYLWLEIPARYKDCEEFASDLLETSGIVVVPGTAFDKDATRYIRISVVASDESLSEVVKRMEIDGFQFEK
ncbi:MAG: aminotransferase class I/II-fold pyridoxal phosphate-dependent enzyme [Candidatus Gastranaerophilales bacterium]|nr:aminotransferase class I/II-fold pyridoxal phosphate-dependent enzyme [Candidatus Gastranaerophilales bacterium]